MNCHAIGDIHHELAHRVLGVPEAEYEALIAVAIGYPGNPAELAKDPGERAAPSSRPRQSRFVFNGRYHPPDEQEADLRPLDADT